MNGLMKWKSDSVYTKFDKKGILQEYQFVLN